MTKHCLFIYKQYFWSALQAYKIALARGTRHDIIMTSLRIHAAVGDVPKSYKRYVNSAFKDTVREIPLDKQPEA